MKEKIFEATITLFNEKGLKFTMDDIAKKLSISKKTIYTIFKDKESLFYEMVDYYFDSVKEAEKEIYEDKNMDIIEKIHRIIIVQPKRYQHVDLRQLYSLQDTYPDIYGKVKKRLENDWEPTLELLTLAISQNRIRPISIPVLKIMVEATIEHFLQRTVLIENKISYESALEDMMHIILEGILL